jgi:hypothetical protein
MKQSQKDALDMFKRAKKHVADTNTISGSRPALVAAMNKLKSQVIDPIDDLNGKQNAEIEGVTRQKEENRHKLNGLLYHVTAGTFGYASGLATPDLVLQGKVKYTIGKIENISDESIVDITNTIIGVVNALNPATNTALNDAGVVAGDITALEAARDAFDAIESDPEELIAIRKSYTDAIEPLVKLGKKILHDEADMVADTLKLTQGLWWSAYHNARKIISTGHRHTIIEGHMWAQLDIPAKTLVPLFGGTVEATHESGKVYKGTTDAEGYFKIVGVKQGDMAKVKYVHTEFPAGKEFEAFKIKQGTVTTKDVVMGTRAVVNSPE